MLAETKLFLPADIILFLSAFRVWERSLKIHGGSVNLSFINYSFFQFHPVFYIKKWSNLVILAVFILYKNRVN